MPGTIYVFTGLRNRELRGGTENLENIHNCGAKREQLPLQPSLDCVCTLTPLATTAPEIPPSGPQSVFPTQFHTDLENPPGVLA